MWHFHKWTNWIDIFFQKEDGQESTCVIMQFKRCTICNKEKKRYAY
jgi:hypothetical protein